MLDPQNTFEREALLKRHREIQAELAQSERNLREGEARLPIEEQLRLSPRRLVEAKIPELAGKVLLSQRLNRFASNCGLSKADPR
jgi:hypothetical protein